jgi:hypothetical protein
LGSMHSNDPITTNDVNVQVLNVLAFFTWRQSKAFVYAASSST